MKRRDAFTMIEMMVVIGLLAVMLLMPVLYTQASQVRFDFNSQVTTIVSYLREAQSDAMSGLNNANHGIHLASNAYTVFSGNSYNPSDPDNYQISLSPTVVIRNVSLSGGGSDVIFTKSTGETATGGTFQLYSSQINKSLTITVSSIGTVNY